MTEQEAISVLESNLELIKKLDGGVVGTLGRAIEVALPALKKQVNGGWIPCSERLPVRNEPFQGKEFTVTIRYKGKCRPISSSASFDFESNKWMLKEYEVIAWQPLPEPYKAGDLSNVKGVRS